ncbi:MAG TPA: YciI family protein [Rhodanobacteraceae bacterium]
MNFSILIYETADDFAARNHAEATTREAYLSSWPPYIDALMKAGVFVGGAGLQQPDHATTLRFEGDQQYVQDGPYADTKEQLGGFVIIDVPDLDTALEWAARVPRSAGRVFEVRPNLIPVDH